MFRDGKSVNKKGRGKRINCTGEEEKYIGESGRKYAATLLDYWRGGITTGIEVYERGLVQTIK